MKTSRQLRLILILLVFPLLSMSAQKTTKSYWIHEDLVKPSMVSEYEKVTKELVKHCQDNDFQGGDWITLVTDDFKYIYVSPVESMADIEKNTFAELYEKLGEATMNELWSRMDRCYSDHEDYILNLDTELSYMPDGISQTPEGMNYRNNTIYYVSPENYQKANEIAKKFNKLYTSKGSKLHYRVYRSGFGANGTYFMVAVAASDPAAYEKMADENRTLLGAEGQALFQELMTIISGMETMQGWMRSDLAYKAK